MNHTYHAVAVHAGGYKTLAQTQGTFEDACNLLLTMYYAFKGRCVVLRIGLTGERLTVRDAQIYLGLNWTYNGANHK